MATYNGEKFIKEQVDTILPQLSLDDELVISDDGSTDKTLEILRSYNDDRVKIFNNNGRKGVVKNFENALMKASGDYIFLADQDDVWMDGKVEQCLRYLKNADLVLHDAVVVDGQLKVISKSFFGLRNSKKGYINNLIKNSFLGCCLAFRKETLSYILPIPDVAMHDIWIGLMISKKGCVRLISEPLLKYRRHGYNASPTSEESNFTKYQQFRYRIKMFFYTFIR